MPRNRSIKPDLATRDVLARFTAAALSDHRQPGEPVLDFNPTPRAPAVTKSIGVPDA